VYGFSSLQAAGVQGHEIKSLPKPPLVSEFLACRLRYSRFGSDTFTPQR